MTHVLSEDKTCLLNAVERCVLIFHLSRVRLCGLAAALSGCQISMPIPEGELNTVGEKVCKIGHPGARYIGSSVVGASSGWFNESRSVDVAIAYTPALSQEERTMTVRFLVETISPCQVRTEVLSDTGPRPRLLDNQYAAPRVGQMVCDMLSE